MIAPSVTARPDLVRSDLDRPDLDRPDLARRDLVRPVHFADGNGPGR